LHARTIGRALAALHKQQLTPADSARLLRQAPWALSMHRPTPAELCAMSSANRPFVSLVQSVPRLCNYLDDLRDGWEALCLVHGDVKWSNFLLTQTVGRQGSRLKLIDWEFAGLGDPCWDLGSAFHDYLSFWLFSLSPLPPFQVGTPTDEVAIIPDGTPDPSARLLNAMQPSIRALWQEYSARVASATDAYAYLLRAMRYAAARLLQSAFEHNQTASRLTAGLALFVQVALNILDRPREAAVRLLGIPPSSFVPTLPAPGMHRTARQPWVGPKRL